MVSTVTAVAGAVAATGYIAGAAVQARAQRSTDAQAAQRSAKLLWIILLPAVILHGLINYQLIGTPAGLNLNLFSSASLVTWIMVCFVLLASLKAPVQNLLVLILPLAVVAIGAELIFDSAFTPIADLSAPLVWHIMLSIVAYSILFMAACQSVLLAMLEDRLRSKQAYTLVRLLPPLETMESLLFTLLWAGVAVLTASIATGFLFLDDLFAQRVVHHTALSLAAWVIYTTLLVGHQFFGWRGTTAVRWALIAFTLLLLGYFGSKFVIEVLLGE